MVIADSVAALANAMASQEDYHCYFAAAGPSSLMATGATLAWIDCLGADFARQGHYSFGKSSAYSLITAAEVVAAGATAPPRYLGSSESRPLVLVAVAV